MLPTRFATCLLVIAASAPLLADNWPQWRGPSLNGVSGESGLPVKWTTTQGIAWKLAMPGFSGSTPIVWGDRIFLNVATADRSGGLELWAVDRNTGQPSGSVRSRAAITRNGNRTCRRPRR